MFYRIKFGYIAAGVLLGAALLSTNWSTAAGSDHAQPAGNAGPSPYEQGCVSCHTTDGPGQLGTLLAALKHRNVDQQTAKVPGDCKECHSEDGGYIDLAEAVHLVHFENPADNPFVLEHGGNCLHCHALDAETGIITVKSGPKNW